MNPLLVTLQTATIACAVISGFFLTFSDFLMRSLALAETRAGVEVMQIINREVWRSLIMVLLWGMLALSLALAGYGWIRGTDAVSMMLWAGAAFYVVGVLFVTEATNIPMNQRLASMAYDGVEAAAYWSEYVRRWSFWNYLRAAASAGAAVCYLVAAVVAVRGG
jgi:uncharacterized membrane protein